MVMRRKPLPTGPATGRLIVAEQVLDDTLMRLRASRGDDGPHEGLVLWLGRRIDSDTYVLSAIAPPTDHSWGRVTVAPEQVGAVSRAARHRRLAIVAQVHSHPGADTRHSDGDDDLVLMPHEGLFSVVVATYGHTTFDDDEGFSIHQFQGGRWVLITDASSTVLAVPPLVLM